MKRIRIVIFACAILVSCSQEGVNLDEGNGCSTPATIQDYRGIDGCGYVLELNDGTILEPLRMTICGPPPQSIMTLDDPLHGFQEDGRKVWIEYKPWEGVSACMAGKLVKITCISESLASND